MARDLDRLRTALGDDTLSYVGFSYGTVIGAVYAQMFPERVGRMVLDSPVDLSASALEELRGNSAGLRAGARRLPRTTARHAPRARSTAAATPPTRSPALEARFEQGLQLPTADLDTGKRTSSEGRGRGVLHRADLRALRQAVRLARAGRRRCTTPRDGDGSLAARTSPTATTGAATTAPTTTSTRSSA